MPKLIWGVTCCRAIIDGATNMVSYIDALDGVLVPAFPAKAPLAIVATMWQREKELKLEVRVKVYSPGGTSLMEAYAEPLDYLPNHKRGRVHVGLMGFDLEGPGRYEFGVEVRKGTKWEEVHRIPFDIDLQPPPAPIKGKKT